MDKSIKFTLALCCYQFERFVTEAVESGFAQTYRPLEIVISDDHSSDATWTKIVDAVIRLSALDPLGNDYWRDASFTGTAFLKISDDFSLILNRNERNLGFASQINKLFELSSGEWIVIQSGDDVSLPDRVEKIATVVGRNPNVRCIGSQTKVIDAEGRSFQIPEKMLQNPRTGRLESQSRLPHVLGAGAVYHRDVYWKFGPLGSHVVNEDHVLPLRGALLGDVEFIDDVLVLYRKHGENMSGVYNPTPEGVLRYRLRMIHMYYQEMIDLHHAEMDLLTDGRLVEHYRVLVRDKLFAFEFLTQWYLHPRMRLSLLGRLLVNPRQILLFLIAIVKKLFR